MPGYGAGPGDHWFPWLQGSLVADGVAASVVALPTPDAPVAHEWEAAVAAALGAPGPGTWVVAHSLGGITTLRVLAALPEPWSLGGLVLVSGFTGPLNALPMLDGYLGADVDVERVRDHVAERVMIRSDADELVPPSASDALAARLVARRHVVPGAGHFLADDGITALPTVRSALHRSERPPH
ncbi:RBBP9/YdeN family alpha/beta hydrolase [Promicromonospora sp. Populi]|uniref:RBBP9/YdeN family alpha/beta hydrolase n=1 Tax=Promicromonospora sp. Populi TaxID=3239420 RepID=UPI0034E25851